jgi:translocation and assembly module TamB
MGRAWRLLLWVLAALLGLVVLAVAAILIIPNTSFGARLIERETASLTGGTVLLQGFAGRFPDRPRIAHIELRDPKGAWLTIDELALDWSPLKLLGGTAQIDRLTASRVAIPRLAEAQPATASSGGSFQLPVHVVLDALHIARVELGAPVAGAAAVLVLDGHADIASTQTGTADVTANRLDAPGTYHIAGSIDPARLSAALQAHEPAHGLVSSIAGLPDLGAIAVTANTDGPWTAAATRLAVTAGPLTANAHGVVNVTGQSAVLDLDAQAPAMTPRPDISWQSLSLQAHLDGPFTKPAATGTFRLAGLSAAGATLALLSADITGNATGHVGLRATLAGLHLPGPQPDAFAAAPITITANADLLAADRPVTLRVAHPMLDLAGTAHAGADPSADLTLKLPDLSPFGVNLQGSSTLHLVAAQHGDTAQAAVTGTIGITGGMAPVPALIGPAATLDLAATLHGSDVTLRQLKLRGKTLSVDVAGGLTDSRVDLTSTIALSDLAAVAPGVQGAIQAASHITGKTDNLTLDTRLTGDVATPGFAKTPLTASLHADGLPGAPSGQVTAQATLQGAPLALQAAVQRLADGATHLTIDRADWKSAHIDGDVTLPPGASIPQGHIAARMTRLDDLRPFLGSPITGSVTLTAAIDAANQAHLRIAATSIAPTNSITLQGDGRADAMELRLAVTGQDVAATSAATLNMPAKQLAVSALQATYKGEHVTLLSPMRLSFADGLSVDRLRLGLRQAVLDVAGRLSPTLDVTASLRKLPADLASVAMPDLKIDGTLQADARLKGTTAAPTGTAHLTATGIHLRTGPGAAFPPANATLSADLAGGTARLDARVALGANQITLAGTAPMAASGPLNLRATARVDLTVLDPLLGAEGRRARGELTADAGITGTVATPSINGSLQFAHGEIQDFAQGVRIHDITALIRATGDTIRIEHFEGTAGNGTMALTGSIGVAAPMPVDLRITARHASPLASDLLTADLNADLTLRGDVQGKLAAGGTVRINKAEIRVPERLPTSVAVLNVRRPGDKPPPPPTPGPDVALDVTIISPGQMFVRGQGLDAELQGRLHVGGTAAAPRPDGHFDLRRGQFSLAGQTLNFTTGTVGLDGSGKLDPTIDFVASSTAGNVTATLTITGYASAPKIALSSDPELPQDEVLAHLLFGQSAAKLGPLQLAEIAAALAQISGATGGNSGFEALNSVRKSLGLDRLTVGGGQGGSGADVQAGRYVAPGVYVGAKQGTSGAGTQAQVQVDLWKGLKLETDVGTGGGTASTGATDSSGTSIGLTYQFDY